jgi:hypothetical protein
LLQALVASTKGAEPVRCWPHHFDLATLIVLDACVDREHSRSVGTGLSPGDETFDEPYWYTNAYPSDASATLRALAGGGFWNREGFFGAVLRGSDLVRDAGADQQYDRASDYLESAVNACTTLTSLSAS